MEFWILFWKIIFIVTILAFSGMAVWVAVGGYQDVKKMFARLEESHRKKLNN